MPLDLEVGEATFYTDTSTTLGLSGSASIGDKESDIGSTAFDIMAMDALQWNDSFAEGLQNLGFADDMTLGGEAASDMAQFLASLQTPFSI